LKDKALVSVLGFAGFISAADNWIVSPVLPAIAKGFNITIPVAGSILTAYLIPYGVMQPVYGFVSDSYGKGKLLKIIVAALAICTLACGLCPSFGLLCAFRALTGFFAAGIIAVSLALIGDTVPENERRIHVGRFMGIVFLGQGLSVGLGGFLADFLNWRYIFILFSIIAFCSVISLRRLPNQPASIQERRNIFKESKLALVHPKGRVIFPLAFATGFLLLGIYSFLGAFFHENDKLNYMQGGMIVMLFGFSCFFVGSHIKSICGKIGMKYTVMLGYVTSLISALLLIAPASIITSCISSVALGVGYILIQSTLATSAFDVASESKGLPSALIGLGIFGGGGLGALLGGFILSISGFYAMWSLFAGLIVFVFIFAALTKKEAY
jgi:predicted MFS family arabinose efflux permease